MHRISHVVPALWALHSFHHSAERLTLATGGRHHVIENILLAPMFFIALMIFQVPEKVMAAAIVIMNIPEALQHLNYKLAWHRVGIWVNTPQWHRIHHSVEPQHVDKNFSSAFPVMDVIFGTAYIPQPDEYPDTGLRPLDNPGVLAGVLWPVRRWLPSRVSRDLEHQHVSSARTH
jgi:sterol desaturase/sphingolipid hydroxylase (fatty acid hydroxylase superfamily)